VVPDWCQDVLTRGVREPTARCLRDFPESGATEAVRRAAKWLNITEAQVRTAESYYASFPDEIDDRVEMNEAAADATQRAGEVRQRLYG
jgi:hypothetical protein